MTTPASSFSGLHRLHLALQEVQEQLDRGPRQIRARQQLVSQAEADLAARREQLKSLRMASDRKSLDLKTNEAKIADLRGKLNVAASNREFDIIKAQIEADTVANSVLQDEILELLDKIDRTQSEIRAAEEKAARAKVELDRFQAQFEADAVGLRARVAELTGEIRRAESGLAGDLAEKYRRLVEAYGADAMSPVEGSTCGHCHVQVTPQHRVLLNSGNVIFCSSCGRLLYKPPEA